MSKRRTEAIEKEQLLHLLHKDQWYEQLLQDSICGRTYSNILSPKERLITDLLIQYFEDGLTKIESHKKIALSLGLVITTVQYYDRAVKSKFRNGIKMDVQKDLKKFFKYPEWCKKKSNSSYDNC